LFSKYNLEIISNFNANIYNNYSINELKELGITTYTISPELDKFEILDIISHSSIETELVVYGKTPVMTNNYCYLGKSNKCYKECDRKCTHNSKFYLKDRMDFKFRILPDNTSTITTIYNSKILSIKFDDIPVTSIRIDILDENPNEIQNVIDTIKSGNRFEGKDYTNGKF
jgi:putative protease